MLPFIAVGTLLAAAASESDWKDELRKPGVFAGYGLLVASWDDKHWVLHRRPSMLDIAEDGRPIMSSSLLIPHQGHTDWTVATSMGFSDVHDAAFPSVWTLLRPAVSPAKWEHLALTSTIQAVSEARVGMVDLAQLARYVRETPDLLDWEGYPTWQDWWRSKLVKPDFVHRGLRLTPLERATGRVPLLSMSSRELTKELKRQK